MSGQATARPWAVLVERGDDYFVIPSWDDESAICRLNGNGAFVAANAHLIVRAVNCHDELLEALEGLLSFAEDAETKALVGDEGCLWPVEIARAAIARARGEQA